MKTLKDAEAVTPEQLKKMTPPEVDELFAAVWDERHARRENVSRAWDDVFHAVGARHVSRSHWSMTFSQVEEKAKAALAAGSTGEAAKAYNYVLRLRASIEALDAGVLAKLEDEFTRRGRWSRAHLCITNGKGHVHRTMHCSTCNKGERPTRFHWKIEWSGKTQDEIIEAAGERACTVCYKDAPTLSAALKKPTQMFTPDEIQAQKDREQRAADKVKRDAVKAAKAITDTDGSPLQVFTRHYPERQVMRGSKVVKVHPAHDGYDTLPTLHQARGWLTDQVDPSRYNDGTHRDIGKVADAIAFKEGKDRQTVIAEAKARAARRK